MFGPARAPWPGRHNDDEGPVRERLEMKLTSRENIG